MLQQHEALANQLRAWRKQEKLTQVAAAALIGMSPSHLAECVNENETLIFII